jgi:precorrin-6Y C5,15-methyltransferase (decarboxylating)
MSRIAVVGIGEDGFAALAPAARALIESAEILAGGQRHLNLVPERPGQQRLPWTDLEDTLSRIAACRGQRLCVVASGDPMWFGIGATLARRFGPASLDVVPAPGAFSLAAARLGLALQHVTALTVHGRPLEAIVPHLAPGAQILVLGEDESTPLKLARLLVDHGYDPSRLVLLSHLGGPQEKIVEGVAAQWLTPGQGLDTILIECRLAKGARALSRVPGLPDHAFLHDGQLTKREVRAATLAALAPLPGELLWDVGAGSGSISIEWMRAASGCRAVAFERDAGRADQAARNALRLGVPGLVIEQAEAPISLKGRKDAPDAVFLGAAASMPGVIETAWSALKPGGRLIANAVTVEAEARLLAWRAEHGGELVRIAVSRLYPIGGFHAWKALAPVTQYRGLKADG